MKIELVCKRHNKKIEISKDVYDFLKEHLIIKNANIYAEEPDKEHYVLRTTNYKMVESVTEEST